MNKCTIFHIPFRKTGRSVISDSVDVLSPRRGGGGGVAQLQARENVFTALRTPSLLCPTQIDNMLVYQKETIAGYM
jgi:hypothetical protein